MSTSSEWQIRVKALLEGGVEKEYQISTLSNETLGDFRAKLASQSHIEPQKQRLIFSGRLLKDNAQTISDTGLRDGYAVNMVALPSNLTPPANNERAGETQQGESRHTPADTFNPGMQQFFSAFPGMGGAGTRPSEEERQRMQRTIRQVYRNFGADDGGEWIAMNSSGQYFSIGREAVVGSQLTAEEYERGPIQERNPVTSSSDESAYETMPGLVPVRRRSSAEGPEAAMERPGLMPTHTRTRPSRALANELIYDLYERVLPSIRRIPGNDSFRFSSADNEHPAYLTRTSTNQIETVSRSLTNMGDAFVELGRSLQALGTEWQMGYSDDTVTQQAQSTLQLLSDLSLASPLIVPFLQSRVTSRSAAQEQEQSRTSTANDESRSAPSSEPEDIPEFGNRAAYQRNFISAHSRRSRRFRAYDMMIGNSRSQPAAQNPIPVPQATFELRFGPIAFPIGGNMHPPTPQEGTQPDPSSFLQRLMGYVDNNQQAAGNQEDAAQRARETGGNSANRNSAASAPRVIRPANMAPGVSTVEFVFERIASPSGGQAAERGNSATEPAQSQQQQQQSRTQSQPAPQSTPQPSQQRSGTSNEAPSAGGSAAAAAAAATDANAGMFDFIQRLGALGAQSARSDRSNNSTTTEYSNGNDAWGRMPRIFGFHVGSGSLPPQQQSQGFSSMLESIMSRATNNPFSTSSVFLGAEPGSTAATTPHRMASEAPSTRTTQHSATSNPAASEAPSAFVSEAAPNQPSTSASVPVASTSASNAFASSAQDNSPRTGETRARTQSTSSSDVHSADEFSRRANSVANKRHRGNGTDDDQQQQ
ncbi:hypothetical protein H4R22_003438 [Coemansia sp. RSA 1290]|nr:hypothetical protein H4R22_003438 [Coemansia sp. RSA 1290]KAJ2650676.1 hypothetical protein IWW40_002184 [Coemansia sp. RSA 1250]